MCLVCAKELYKERRRQDYANKRRKQGQIATRRLTPNETRAEHLELWSKDLGDNELVARRKHNDFG